MTDRKKTKRWSQMTADELAAATKEFDKEGAIEGFGPPPPHARARLAKATKRGRPRKGAGVKVIAVSVERNLLARSDALAKHQKISRAALIARGLRAVLVAAGEHAENA